MYVRKFEAETIDEALKSIKAELGPDAIILKTTTNKGIKGAFKKNKIEITAAISEKNYTRKAKVDHVLDDGQKESFYNAPSEFINNMIDSYSGNEPKKTGGYGEMGLNKSPKVKNQNGLDAFLSREKETQKVEAPRIEERTPAPIQQTPVAQTAPTPTPMPTVTNIAGDDVRILESTISDQKNRIEELEKQVYELVSNFEKFRKDEPLAIRQLTSTLRSFEVDETFVQQLVRKAHFELSTEELQNTESAFEFALREMLGTVKVDMPLFSKSDVASPITVLTSKNSSGQTSTIIKLASLVEDAEIICFGGQKEDDQSKSFSHRVFGYAFENANTLPELISCIRKAREENKKIFIDLKEDNADREDTKSIIDSVKRSFSDVEVLVCLSALHSEMYNKKVIGHYRAIANGLVVSHIDQCLNFGSLFNIGHANQEIPFKFFGTGEIVPDDLESATPERILDGIFQLS